MRATRRTTRAPDVVEQRPARVGRVGGVHRAAGEVPQHPAVDGAEGKVVVGFDAAFGQQPVEFGAREVRVEHQAGGAPDQVEVPGLAQRVAILGGAAVLPDDGAVARLAGAPVPHHGRLALVGDADRGDRSAVERRVQLGQRGAHRVGDLGGVVLDPSWSREVLGELAVGPARGLALGVDGEGPHTGRPGIDGDHHAHGSARRNVRRGQAATAPCPGGGTRPRRGWPRA